MAREDQIKAHDLEMALRARVDTLVPKLLAGARRAGAYWECADVGGGKGTQMKVNRQGARQGLWTDFSASPGSDEHSGDMLQLVAAVHFGGWNAPGAQAKAIAWAKSELGYDDLSPDRLARVKRETATAIADSERQAELETAGKRRSALALWHGATDEAGTPARTYLEGRVPGLAALGHWPGSLRFLPDAWCPVRRGKYPAMIACIVLGGKIVGVHRTYLDVSGGKSGPVTVFKLPPDPKGRRKSHKLSLGPYTGGHIPLWKGACPRPLHDIAPGTDVYVSEGIEDGLTIARAFPERRVVAGVALANMGGLLLPPQAGALIFVGQRDPIGGQALEAFEHAVARQQAQAAAQGRPMPGIIWPDEGYKDFNDQLLGKRMAEAA